MRIVALLLMTAILAIPANAEQVEDRCAAPCGWINPIIDLRFPDKPDCGGGLVLGQDAGPDACMIPPSNAEPIVLGGTLNWYWDASYEGTYPADPGQPITLDFGKTSTHPSWLDFEVEPATFTIDNTVLLDPQYFRQVETGDAVPAVYFWYEQPITITFTRVGDPAEQDLERMRGRDGIQALYVKAHSTASGSQIRESYGIEEFLFHAANAPDVEAQLNKDTPGLGALAFLGALGAAMAARRS